MDEDHRYGGVVLLKWVDSANLFGDRWADPEDLDIHKEETYCLTIGWLVAENTHSVYVASSLAPDEIGSVMQIPQVCIRTRTKVFGADAPSVLPL